jgi:hypothetical protein
LVDAEQPPLQECGHPMPTPHRDLRRILGTQMNLAVVFEALFRILGYGEPSG